MTIGPYFLMLDRSLWPDWGAHLVKGWNHAPIYFRMEYDRPVYCRGFVLALGPLMLWATRVIRTDDQSKTGEVH